MSEHSPGSNGSNHIILKLIASFVSLSSHLVYHQIDVTSAHFATAFNIPVNNISIYFNKLFSFRCLLIGFGTAADFLISQIANAIAGNNRGDNNGSNRKVDSGREVRKYLSIGCFMVLSAIRILFLFLLYASKNLAYHIYIVLSLDGLFFGFFHSSVLALAPEHSLAIALSANISRFFILLVQFILDLFLSNNPLLMIKIQTWIGNIFTVCAICSWLVYHFGKNIGLSVDGQNGQDQGKKSEGAQNQGKKAEGAQNQSKCQERSDKPPKDFGQTLMDAISPFLMFFAGSMFKDFLFPGVLPYALLERRKCHLINMLVPIANMFGPVFLFILEVTHVFHNWQVAFNGFWLLVLQMGIIFWFTLSAIHTRNPVFRKFVNNRNLVLLETLLLVFSNGFLDPLSFSGVAKIVKPTRCSIRTGSSGSNSHYFPYLKFCYYCVYIEKKEQGENGEEKRTEEVKEGDNGVISFHVLLALFMRMVFSKLAVGYNDVRVGLGYTLPRFRPRHRMSKKNLFWYIFKNVFRRAALDTLSDFKMNIKDYL